MNRFALNKFYCLAYTRLCIVFYYHIHSQMESSFTKYTFNYNCGRKIERFNNNRYKTTTGSSTGVCSFDQKPNSCDCLNKRNSLYIRIIIATNEILKIFSIDFEFISFSIGFEFAKYLFNYHISNHTKQLWFGCKQKNDGYNVFLIYKKIAPVFGCIQLCH